jgi:hypothetical protein
LRIKWSSDFFLLHHNHTYNPSRGPIEVSALVPASFAVVQRQVSLHQREPGSGNEYEIWRLPVSLISISESILVSADREKALGEGPGNYITGVDSAVAPLVLPSPSNLPIPNNFHAGIIHNSLRNNPVPPHPRPNFSPSQPVITARPTTGHPSPRLGRHSTGIRRSSNHQLAE